MQIGHQHSIETKLKMSKIHKKNPVRFWLGKKRPMSEETKRKIGEKNQGKIHSLKSRENMSNAHKGRCYSPRTKFKKGNVPWNKGKKLGKNPAHSLRMIGRKLTNKTRYKMSLKQKKRVVEGKHNNYKGGITSKNLTIRASLEYRLWREAVFKRDNWTCVWCGQRGGKLNADHIKPFSIFPELRLSLDNGRTLCVRCHKTINTRPDKHYENYEK